MVYLQQTYISKPEKMSDRNAYIYKDYSLLLFGFMLQL